MSRKKSSLLINDLVEELAEENKRLFNELSIAGEFNKLLIEFKTFVDLNSVKFKLQLDSNGLQKFEDLNQKLSTFDNNYQRNDGLNCDINRENIVIKWEDTNNLSEELRTDENQKNCRKDVATEDNGNQKGVDKPHECCVCHKRFSYKKSLRKHLLKHPGVEQTVVGEDTPYVCKHPDCGYQGLSARDLKRHSKSHSVVTSHNCPICDKTFHKIKNLREHVKNVHEVAEEMLVCEVSGCNRKFKNQHCLQRHHKNKHLYNKKFECDHPNCQYRAQNRAMIIRHQLYRHSEERPFKCTIDGCLKAFSDQQNLSFHQKTVHSTGTKRYGCEWPGCEYSSVFKYEVRKHRITHTQERNFKCDVKGCLKTCKTANNLSKHKKQFHKMGKQLLCQWPGCDFNTFYVTSLRQHLDYHQTGGQHTCDWPDCTKRFAKKQNLEEHINTVHKNVKPFVCSVSGCLYRTAVSGNLSKHLKKHIN